MYMILCIKAKDYSNLVAPNPDMKKVDFHVLIIVQSRELRQRFIRQRFKKENLKMLGSCSTNFNFHFDRLPSL